MFTMYESDSLTLVYVDVLQRMMSHTVRLIATAALRPSPSRPPSRGGVIGLPNPLNILRTHLGAPEEIGSKESAGRIEVEDRVELGAVSLEGTIIANRSILTSNGRRTIFWTESGLTVGAQTNDYVRPLTRFRSSKSNLVVSGKFG